MTRTHYKKIDFGKLKPNKKTRFKGNLYTVILRFFSRLKILR